MSDDEHLRNLIAVARQERDARAADPAWEKLTLGEANESERAELERRAESDADDARALALHRPLDARAEDRFTSAILGRAAPRKAKPSRVVLYLAPPLAAAAAIALFLARGASPESSPEYALAFATTTRVERAPVANEALVATTLDPSSLLDVVVRPREAVSGPIAVRAALVRDGQAQAWKPPIQISAGGSVRIVGTVADLLPSGNGAWEVVLGVGAPGALPSETAFLAVASRASAPPRGVSVVRGRVDVTPAP